MKAELITAPASLPITLEEMKVHLRIEDSESEYDSDLTSLINVADEWISANCHLTLINSVYRCYFDKFENPMRLPFYPVLEVDNFAYTDANGNSAEITNYQLDRFDSPAKIYPAISAEWPKVQNGKINPISIDVECGMAETSTTVPALAKHLIRLLVGHWFVNREAVKVGTITKEIEFSANELVKMLRVNEFEAF